MEFKTIETQEQFDAAIGERLKREESKIRKEYQGFLSPEEVAKLRGKSVEELFN